MASQKAFLIDGTAFCYRAFYAIRHLSTSDGRPTNAVYGVAMMLQALREKEQPDYLGVAFDVGKPTFRHQKFEAYKGQRKPMPDPLIAQLPLVKRLLGAYRIPVFEREGYEAEDVLATIAKRIVEANIEVFLVTGDKDALQLVNSHIKVYNPHKEHLVLDAAAVQARYGVGPERMVDLMALMGDEIDNIPGVPGIGEKTATQLLQQFGSLERLYAHLDDIESPVRRKALEASREQVRLARELARIDQTVPLEVTLTDLQIQEPDWRALRAIFRELEFKRLLQAIEPQAVVASTPASTQQRHLVVTPRDLSTLCTRLAARGSQAVALMGWPIGDPAEAVMMALALTQDETWLIRLERHVLETSDGRRVADWFGSPTHPKTTHDAKSAKHLLAKISVTLKGLVGDTMVAAYLLNPARTNQALSDLSDEYLDEPLPPLPPVQGASLLSEFSFDAELSHGVRVDGPRAPRKTRPAASPVSVESHARWEPFARSVSAVLRLHGRLLEKLHEHRLAPLYTELELPLVEVLAQMEATGIALDLPYLASLRASMDAKLTQLTQEIYRLAGCSFNLHSPKQLAQVLFERLKLPIVKRTKTGPSTDSDVLQQLAAHHPLPQQLMQYRELSKLVSTYVDALPKLVNPRTGRLHTSFNQTATTTGRLSSSEPNLQNIPIKTELGRSIRKAFIPGIRDGLLVAADYSQIELRILAHLSGDPHLKEAFHQHHDIHRFTASLIYGIPETEVQPAQRQAMKVVNYGILYGMTSHGLSKELGVSFEEAQAFIDAYFQRYPNVREYLDSQIAQAKREGFVQTLLGRRRYIPEIQSSDMVIRQFAERMAVNAPIQGTAADLIKRAMIQVAAALEREQLQSRMVLQVHDELVFEVPRTELDRLVALARRLMEGAIVLTVPLTITIKTGPNWLDLSPVE